MDRRTEPGFPHKGWSLVSVDDLGGEDGIGFENYPSCEYCDHPQIRYIHTLCHPDFATQVKVGCVCAEFLTEDYVNPKERERDVRNRSLRRQRFLKLKGWKIAGTTEYIAYKNSIVRVRPWPDGGAYRLVIDEKYGRKRFLTINAAKLAAFDYLNPAS